MRMVENHDRNVRILLNYFNELEQWVEEETPEKIPTIMQQIRDHLEEYQILKEPPLISNDLPHGIRIVEAPVVEREKEFVEFFNTADAINTRVHQLELLPGFGKKHTGEILDARKEKKFVSFDDLKKRLPSLPDPKKAIEKRITLELTEMQRQKEMDSES